MKRVATPAETGRVLGVSRQRAAQLIASGALATGATTIDGHRLADAVALQRLAAQRCASHADARPCNECEIVSADAGLWGAIESGDAASIARQLYGDRR